MARRGKNTLPRQCITAPPTAWRAKPEKLRISVCVTGRTDVEYRGTRPRNLQPDPGRAGRGRSRPPFPVVVRSLPNIPPFHSSSRRQSPCWRWVVWLCALGCGWLGFCNDAAASCGDYVRIGNPGAMSRSAHLHAMTPGSNLTDQGPATPSPCAGGECRRAPVDSQLPPTRAAAPHYQPECVLCGSTSVSSPAGSLWSGDLLLLSPQQVGSGLLRPPRSA